MSFDHRSFVAGFIVANCGRTLIFRSGSFFECLRFNSFSGLIESAILEPGDFDLLDGLESLSWTPSDTYNFDFNYRLEDLEKAIYVDNSFYMSSF